jgi:hypothetical protein
LWFADSYDAPREINIVGGEEEEERKRRRGDVEEELSCGAGQITPLPAC